MGTNYYVKIEENKCECCNRADTYKIHIGKKSWGWAFSFRGHRKGQYAEGWKDDVVSTDLTSWKQYKEFLKDKLIVDEYGDTVTYDEFVELVEVYGSPSWVNLDNGHKNLVHNIEIRNDPKHYLVRNEYNNPEMHWECEDGYSFSKTEFF